MIAMLALLVLGQPDADQCQDRRPGLSKCVQFWPETVDKGVTVRWGCKAVCYLPKHGRSNDGGTDASILTASGESQPLCKAHLEEKCKP